MSSRITKVAACRHPQLDKKLRCKTCGVKVDIREKKNKYGNRKVFLDGMWFDSVKESKRYLLLKNDPLVFGLECQKEYSLEVRGHVICKYRADFVYARVIPPKNTTRLMVEDVKSKATKTAVYLLKKRLMKAIHNIDIQEVI